MATIYFPIAPDHNSFDSTLGRWRWKSVKEHHKPLYDYLLSLQPFSSEDKKWLFILNDLAVQGKHIDLAPQKRIEENRITVTAPGGVTMSWNPANVRFGSGATILIGGVPINPATQRIIPTPGATEKIEVWVSFEIDGHGVNALSFCQLACSTTRTIVETASNRFQLS